MGAFPQIGGSTKLSVTGNAKCGTGDGATMRPREVKRELIRALAPAAGGLFTGAQWRARVTARKAAKGEPEQEGPLTESAFIWIVPAWAPCAGLLWRFSFESLVLPWPISVP